MFLLRPLATLAADYAVAIAWWGWWWGLSLAASNAAVLVAVIMLMRVARKRRESRERFGGDPDTRVGQMLVETLEEGKRRENRATSKHRSNSGRGKP